LFTAGAKYRRIQKICQYRFIDAIEASLFDEQRTGFHFRSATGDDRADKRLMGAVQGAS
jgi:hypothetical protein